MPGVTEPRLLDSRDGSEPLWSGALNAGNLDTLLESPARKELLKRILDGESVIWVVVENGTPDGKAAAERMEKRLRYLEQVIGLPPQDPDDPDSQLGPGPALKLKLTLMRVSQKDAAEKLFCSMLAGKKCADVFAKGECFAAPVFGRGRVLGAWPLADLDDTTIEDATMFLTGRCSCRVKKESPGWDVLLKVDWDTALRKAQDARRGQAAPVTKSEANAKPQPETVRIEPTKIGNSPADIFFFWLSLGLAAGCSKKPWSASGPEPIMVYCAANLVKPVTEIAAQYQKELGIAVSLEPGGSGTLLSQLQVAKKGDLFIAADDGTMGDAKSKKLVREVLPLVTQHPVVAVKKGNAKGVHALADLMKAEVKLSLPDPGAASIGKVTRKVLGDQWQQLAGKAVVMKATVSDVAADVQLGAVDAGIVWDSTIGQFKDLEAVELPELTKHRENASVAVLSFCDRPTEALKFARYLAAPDRGGLVFKKFGFATSGGDKWAVKPEMILYSGGVNRLAIEKLLQDFSDREGASVTTVFNGCGILCAAMKTMGSSSNPKFPDAYYACDVCFVPPVAKYFPEAVLLTETKIVIAVPKGNPHHVGTLADLAQPGLRLGLCNAEQSTLGFMTHAILKTANVLDSVTKNAVMQTPTADSLINELRVGALDAAIVYQVNVLPQSEHFEAIPLPDDLAKAVQPFAVRADSANRQLSQRLLAFLKEHRENFEKAGFVWTGSNELVPSDKLSIPDWLKAEMQKG